MTTFPLAPTGLRVALDFDGSGAFATDVTAYLREGSGVSITRGLGSEGSQSSASTMRLTFDNSDFRFSPGNPHGPYFGKLVKNVPILADLPAISTRLEVPAGVTVGLSTPDSVPLSITGIIDIRIDAELTAPQGTGQLTYLISKWTTAGNQRSWALLIDDVGKFRIYGSADGATGLYLPSTECVPRGPKRQTFRVVYNPNAGVLIGKTASFYVGPSLTGPWTQVGGLVAGGGTTSIYDSTSPVRIGDLTGLADMNVYGARIYSGDGEAGGTLVSNLDLTGIAPGATTVTDAQGNVWTPGTGATLQTRDVRFVGVVPDWKMSHGDIAEDCEVEILARDETFRRGRTQGRLASTYRRACTSTASPMTGLVAYWPMEDAAAATYVASGLPGSTPMTITGSPTFAADSTFACSDPLLKLTTGSVLFGEVPPYAGTGNIQVWLLVKPPATGATGAGLLTLTCSGTAPIWRLEIDAAGNLSLDAWDQNGTTLSASGWTSLGAINGKNVRIGLLLEQVGSDVRWTVTTLIAGATSGLYMQGTLVGYTVSQALTVKVAPNLDQNDMVAGHLTVQSVVTSVFYLDWQLAAYVGETAMARALRLCQEEGVAFQPFGLGDTAMGAQRPGKLLDLLQECATADAGILFTPRGRAGIAYRSTDSMSARDAALTVSYTSGGIFELTPNEDDSKARNDVELQRTDGSSYRMVQLTGPMSIQDPPNGIGVYEGGGSQTVNLATDTQLRNRVGWELHAGTVAEPRCPEVGFDLGATTYRDGTAAQVAQQRAIRELDIGDRFTVTDLPAWGSPDGLDQIMIGYREDIATWSHRISAVSLPASMYRVFVYGSTRYSGEGTVLNGAITTTAQTSIPVTSPAGVSWTHVDGNFDVATGGEVMTVTAVSGSGTSWTFTVIRGVNGVLKVHPTGQAIDVAKPGYWSM